LSTVFSLEDYRWLMTPEGARLLEQVAGDNRPVLQIARTLRKDLTADRSGLVLEQVELRKRARVKFPHADRMFFTRRALEQATDGWLAAYKARRFVDSPRVVDFCCGIGGDLMALAQQGPTIGIDRDPLMIALASANLAVCNETCQPSEARIEDVSVAALSDAAAWHIDPDRRSEGRRTTRVEFYEPSPDDIDELRAAVPHAAVKLAPAATVPSQWASDCECEWISRGGECRQLVAWFGDLTRRHGKRTATVLDRTGGVLGEVHGDDKPLAFAERIGGYVFEPDAAVLAASLHGQLASDLQLAAIAPGIGYLTSDESHDHPALQRFVVTEVMPFRPKRIKAVLTERGIGPLEVKKRGVEVDPAKLSRELRGKGLNEAVLIVTRFAGKVVAILAHR
jgi:hypothetical protein